jgi:hypothetical protein
LLTVRREDFHRLREEVEVVAYADRCPRALHNRSETPKITPTAHSSAGDRIVFEGITASLASHTGATLAPPGGAVPSVWFGPFGLNLKLARGLRIGLPPPKWGLD